MTKAAPAPPTEHAPRWIEYRRPEDLPPDPGNPKDHAGELILASILANGVIEPQVLDERTGLLISGHGRREQFIAAEQAWSEKPEGERDPLPDGAVLDDEGRWTVPVVRGWASRDEAHARAALVVLNRAGEKGGWFPDLLAAALEEATQAMSLEAMGYDQAGLDELLAASGQLGQRAGSFLDDIAGSGDVRAPNHGARTPVYDGVEMKFSMSPAERDEAVALLRQHQRRLGTETLTDTLLSLLRVQPPPAEPPAEP